MVRPHLPMNALKAFEASARHLSFTRAAIELAVTQAAVSHQVKSLEERLGSTLFRRLPRGLALTDEGQALLPALRDSFDRMAAVLEQFEDGHVREVLNVGVVGTFAIGWLIERLPAFKLAHPFIDLRLSTNNNRVDIAAEGLDFAIRFGDGAWHSTEADRLFAAPLSVLCLPEIAERLSQPHDLYGETLLRSYRADEWPSWFAAAAIAAPTVKGPIFDSSRTMVEAAILGAGVALAPPLMFQRQLAGGVIQQPFEIFVTHGCYWLTWLKSSALTPAMRSFQAWILAASLPYSEGNG